MFVKAIEEISKFTRPIHSIMRSYGSNKVFPGASTLFFVNQDGAAITCRHVAEHLVHADKLNQQYLLFSQSRFRLKQDEFKQQNLAQLEQQFNYNSDTIVQTKHNFVACFDKISGYDCNIHPHFDLAIIQFKGFQQTYYQDSAKFIRDSSTVKPGKMLCRLGFPFPEFTNFHYNHSTDDIEWNREGNPRSPSFPIEGIITRLISQNGQIGGIEMSSPGLRGQSGGPLFDPDGIIYGMQSSTRHLHLGFDLENFELPVGAHTKKITNMPFLHVGQCIHVDVIKEFLSQHKVKFEESI
jgi:hypothetical protein